MIRQGLCLAGAMCLAVACSTAPQRDLPLLRGAPSSERPAWLRDLPVPLERFPAPQRWGGDYLASAD